MRLDVVLQSLRSARADGASRTPLRTAAIAPRGKTLSRGGTTGINSGSGSSVDQDHTEIVDVCLGGTTDDEPAGSLEEAGGVVIVEELLGIEVARVRKRLRGDHRSCGVRDLTGAAVDAIRVCCQGGNTVETVE